MTEPSDAAKRKACELELKQNGVGQIVVDPLTAEYIKGLRRAFALYIDEVDRVARLALDRKTPTDVIIENLRSLMLPDPVDPLEEVCEALGLGLSKTAADELRAELDKRGFTIAPKEQGRLTDGIL